VTAIANGRIAPSATRTKFATRRWNSLWPTVAVAALVAVGVGAWVVTEPRPALVPKPFYSVVDVLREIGSAGDGCVNFIDTCDVASVARIAQLDDEKIRSR
jgi:hypothetical protein